MIVDSQVHLWPAETPERPWPEGGAERAHLPHPFTYQQMLALMDEGGVDRVIIVPPSWEGDRNDYALEAARTYPDRFAVMGRLDIGDPATADLLPGWLDQSGMLGLRLTFMRAQANWLSDGTAAWFWPEAEAANIPIMVHPAGQTAAIGEIAKAHPGLRIIIDHMGLNRRIVQEGRREAAIGETETLAAYPNVAVKLSGAPTYSNDPFPFADMNANLQRLVDAFGPERCFWGTDASHFFDRCSYRQRVTHFTEELDFLSEDDKALIMGKAILAYLNWA